MPKPLRPKRVAKHRVKRQTLETSQRLLQRKGFQKPGCHTFKKVRLDDITTTLLNVSDLDFDSCTLPEVIRFLHKVARDPHSSTLNLAFMDHITNALIKGREEKLRLEASIPRTLEDGWDP